MEIETKVSIEELKLPQEYQNNSFIILDDLNEKETNKDKILAKFKPGRHNSLSTFIISQEYYQLPKGTNRADGNIYHIFKPNKFRDVQNLYQDKASMNMTLNEFKNLSSTSRSEKISTPYN